MSAKPLDTLSSETRQYSDPALSSLGFSPELCEWWDLLSNEYQVPVLQVQSLYQNQMNFGCLCLEDFPNITAYLDTLKHETGGTPKDASFSSFVVSFFKPLPQTIWLICTTLASYDLEDRQTFQEIQARWKELRNGQPKILAFEEPPRPLDGFLREGVCALACLSGFEISFAGVWSARPDRDFHPRTIPRRDQTITHGKGHEKVHSQPSDS